MYKLFFILTCSLCLIQICFAIDYEEEWKNFKKNYNKIYSTSEEETERKEIFIKNLKTFEEHNEHYKEGNETYFMGINEYSDLNQTEFIQTMTVTLPDDPDLLKINSKNVTLRGPLPNYVNWVERGFNTTARQQGGCGSCYAFGAVAALEAQFYIKHKSYIKVSEQNAVDCSRFYGNFGCRGGWPSKVFEYAKQQGIGLNGNFPYKGREDQCVRAGSHPYMRIKNYYRVQINNETEMKKVVATIGPVTVAIDASRGTFHGYRGGVYYDPECKPNKFTHIVLVVGYGTSEKGEDYWLIKNSWSPHWGQKGYAKMARNKNNHCGIATHAVYPILK